MSPRSYPIPSGPAAPRGGGVAVFEHPLESRHKCLSRKRAARGKNDSFWGLNDFPVGLNDILSPLNDFPWVRGYFLRVLKDIFRTLSHSAGVRGRFLPGRNERTRGLNSLVRALNPRMRVRSYILPLIFDFGRVPGGTRALRGANGGVPGGS